ncbi:hypothetical protein [Treponema denticola]|uniref:hypothetical protein n=1 Tax=Treponema denticola TaxID=158 RepID=UPI0020A4FFB0|nr:hypothetical protein [Treponema denticola]UTC82770.1 hypothetical protein HGJ18_05950 [Treponema denticola]
MAFNNDWNFWIGVCFSIISIVISVIGMYQAIGAKKAALAAKKLLSNRNAEVEFSKMITKLQTINYKITYEEADAIISELSAVSIDQYNSNVAGSVDYDGLKAELEKNLLNLRINLQKVIPLTETQEPGIVYNAINEHRYNLINTFAKIKSDLRNNNTSEENK